jgi:hypothetical protein
VKQGLDMRHEAGKHTFCHQLNGRKLLVVFNSANSEGMQQSELEFDNFIWHHNRDIFKSIYCIGLMVRFSAMMNGIV